MLKQKIILDTDIGDDIDDALALALALEMPEIELVGVTTVYLDTDKRARIAQKILSLWGVDVPVYAGMRKGDTVDAPIDNVPCQYTPDLDDKAYAPLNNVYEDNGAAAVDFIIQSAEKYGKELVVVAIGALTNVAAALRKAPESMKKIQRIVLMGGCFYRQFREWNILCDPQAAKEVLAFDGEVVCVGLDVTEQAKLSNRQYQDILAVSGDARLEYLASLVRLHNAYTGCTPVLHDPLTVYYVAHPEILLTEPVMVEVETKGEFSTGMTINVDLLYDYLPYRMQGRRLLAAKAVRAKEFMEQFMQMVFHIGG